MVASLQRPPPSSSFNESLEDPKSLQLLGSSSTNTIAGSIKPAASSTTTTGVVGLSLKSPLDLESARPEEPVSPPVISTNNKDGALQSGPESPTSDPGGSIQAALAALQAGQISLNQLSMQLMALGKFHFM